MTNHYESSKKNTFMHVKHVKPRIQRKHLKSVRNSVLRPCATDDRVLKFDR